MEKIWHVVILSLGSLPIMAGFLADWWKKQRLEKAKEFEKSKNYRQAAEIYENIGDYGEAARCYKSAEAYSSSAKAHEQAGNYYGAAVMYQKAGNHSSAAKIFEQIEKYDEACYRYYDAKNYVKSIETAIQALNTRKNNHMILWLFAKAITELGEKFYQLRGKWDYEVIARLLEKGSNELSIRIEDKKQSIGCRGAIFLVADERHVYHYGDAEILAFEKSSEIFEHIKYYEAAVKVFDKARQFCLCLNELLKVKELELQEWMKSHSYYEKSDEGYFKQQFENKKEELQECQKERQKLQKKAERFIIKINSLLSKDQEINKLFQQQHNIISKPLNEQIIAYIEILNTYPQNFSARFSLITRYLQSSQWETAFKEIQQLFERASHVNQAKAFLLRAQCYFGRAQGADIRLGLQDVEQVITQHPDAPVLQELLDVAAQLRDAEYIRSTGTNERFPREYERILTLLIADIECRFKAAIKAGNADNLLDIALQLWRIGYHDLTLTLLDELGNGYAQQIAKNVAVAQQVMATADAYWKRAQEQPEMAVYDAIAERLWQAAATALAKQLPLAQITAQNVESYYLLFKAYQALRELPKCEEVGVKILGVTGFAGYKDVRPIVDNLVTGGFDAQQWRSTGDGAPTPTVVTSGKVERFGDYTGTYFTKGGMGEIYKGAAPDGSPVAIKRIPRYALNGVPLERFLREIRLLQGIEHPNIVKILDFNEQEGYYVMEWTEHGTLEDRLKQQKTLPAASALEITLAMANALASVHQQGVIHRDLKPSNILLFSGNRFKLTDFGIAYIEADERLTRTGDHPGTPRYMSPEQCMGAATNEKTDIFSLGLILHEMLTGDIPNRAEFVHKDSEDILAGARFLFPEEVRNILVKCLRNNDHRRCSASELCAELQRMIQSA